MSLSTTDTASKRLLRYWVPSVAFVGFCGCYLFGQASLVSGGPRSVANGSMFIFLAGYLASSAQTAATLANDEFFDAAPAQALGHSLGHFAGLVYFSGLVGGIDAFFAPAASSTPRWVRAAPFAAATAVAVLALAPTLAVLDWRRPSNSRT